MFYRYQPTYEELKQLTRTDGGSDSFSVVAEARVALVVHMGMAVIPSVFGPVFADGPVTSDDNMVDTHIVC